MSLAALQLRTETVVYEQQEIKLYGLSSNAIAGLILSQMSSLESLFDIVQAAGVKGVEDINRVDVGEIGQRLLAEAPEFMARVIAYAAHEPDHWHKVLHLPSPVQLKCLTAVAKLTFNDEAGFREFVGNVAGAVRNAKSVLPQNRSLSATESVSLDGGGA